MLRRSYLGNKFVGTSLLILSLVISTLSSGTFAHATSLADDTVHVLDNIRIGGAGDSCEEQIRTKNWLDPTLWRSTWNYQSNYSNAQADTEAFIAELETNMEAGSGWAVMQRPNPNNGNMNMITIQTFSPSATVTILNSATSRPQVSGFVRSFDIFLNPGSGCRVQSWNSGAQNVSAYGNNLAGDYGYLLVASNSIIYPDGYAGEYMPSTADADGDGLSLARELTQGTFDSDDDYDDDGLNDYSESRWHPDRNDIFCGSIECAYPNPIKKDLYVEVDWMYKNFRDYKPTSTQISKVIDAYNTQGILAHFDTGQYGGGEQLPWFSGNLIFKPTENQFDFYDMKSGISSISAQFNTNRYKTWHYMITGFNFMVNSNEEGSTGASYPGDDDSIISIEKIESIAQDREFDSSETDTAVAGTMLHELGHNLCLSDSGSENYRAYPNQAEECIYSEIDKELGDNPSEDYASVMNYRFQLSSNDYSHGANGTPEDHDDWLAIMLGIGDFTNSLFEWDSTYTEPVNLRGRGGYHNLADDIQH